MLISVPLVLALVAEDDVSLLLTVGGIHDWYAEYANDGVMGEKLVLRSSGRL